MNKLQNKINNKDLFAIGNILLFIWYCYAVFFESFIHYRGREHLWEFFVYAVAILIVILFAWILTRQINFPSKLLFFAEIIILIHFAGGLIILNESRLYDNFILGIRFDKYAHIIQTFMGSFILYELHFKNLNLKWWIKDLQLIIMMLGIGAVFEIIEYLITLTIDINGVGGYDNNMQDMISNFIGASVSILFIRISSLIKDTRENDQG